ncbi:amyloid protein-binding protein 2 isoform X2 [Agrilus planipennis]|uniref:Amyloid protein-binding protein 2 isoform X1 n=1 Tax=Agrilus planipennis TaxID=224129 RepID=A0A1W4X0A5_AGRPL|nr:amyloid protein-binding protein 2 isoform X1 [Agrilus planipennis]XP_025833696.1 amyloid protein-binding protein 2 isoform X2 [Agrilus planipennis]
MLNFKMSKTKNPKSLYNLCINIAVVDCLTLCKFCKKDFRILPNNVLFDFYYKMYIEDGLWLLGLEYSELEVFSRMLKVKHNRTKLLKSFQSLIKRDSNIMYELIKGYAKLKLHPETINFKTIELGLQLGTFFNEGGWYSYAIQVLDYVEEMCRQMEQTTEVLCKLLECYQKRLQAEATFCMFKEAEKTYNLANLLVIELKQLNALPNLSSLYALFSALFFVRSEYDEAYSWAKNSLLLLKDNLPTRIIVEVLRQASKSCVVKRRFDQAGLLIRQAVSLASKLYKTDEHPSYSDTLIDYGFFLLNFDSIQQSVKVYEKALSIRKDVFDSDNIHVAIGYEDLAYALYVNEYSSGRFNAASENIEAAIKIFERILPKDHLMLASAKRVKALILEEIALDLRDLTNPCSQEELLAESERLHKSALALSHAAFGERNVQTAKHYGNLGRLYQSMMEYEEAEKMHLRAIAIKEELLGPDDYEVALSIGHLASLYNYHMKRHRDAEKLYKRSIEINLRLFGDSYSGLEYDYRGLINVYTELHDIETMLHYTQLMREWKCKRDVQVPIKIYPDSVQPLHVVIQKFFDLC